MLHLRPEPPAPTAQHLPTSALPVGVAFLPGLGSSVTSGHTAAARVLIRCHGDLQIRRMNRSTLLLLLLLLLLLVVPLLLLF